MVLSKMRSSLVIMGAEEFASRLMLYAFLIV